MKQVTAVLIGAGLRGGQVYASYALEHPEELKIVAVAEPDEQRRKEFAQRHGISEENQFSDYGELLIKDKMADCAMVCTQDTMHYEPVIKAMEKGYHVLCEKPMSPDTHEIVQMGQMTKKYGRILMICHVLRYSAFFSKIKECLEQGKIGRLMSIQHIEEVGYWHHAHSFVRGNWRRSEDTSPMILQKCCHDMDILMWLIDSPCTKVSSFGERTFFRKENAPEGAPAKCLDGCSHRDECAFYAPDFYLNHPKAKEDGLVYAVWQSTAPDSVMDALREGPYGRCVFHCDNTVVDHQVVNLEFENQVTASLTMSAFTKNCSRIIHLMGSRGQMKGNMEEGSIEIDDFVTGEKEMIWLNTPAKGHSGSDSNMMKDFVKMIAGQENHVKSSAEVSVASHLIALAAEES
ncbi:MAG: Gfo/Idh/MocA family oxidoreductase, partial [Lachnospiraceae bacterium]|nr:Gfo/Idh/MocA family oxidoreductase [Lachnospiraceae bacterium]